MRIPFAIYLPNLFHQFELLGLAILLPLDQSLGSTRWVMLPTFTGLYLMDYTIKFYHNPNAVHHQSPGYKICQNNSTELPPYQVFCQLLLMVNALEQHWCYQLLL